MFTCRCRILETSGSCTQTCYCFGVCFSSPPHPQIKPALTPSTLIALFLSPPPLLFQFNMSELSIRAFKWKWCTVFRCSFFIHARQGSPALLAPFSSGVPACVRQQRGPQLRDPLRGRERNRNERAPSLLAIIRIKVWIAERPGVQSIVLTMSEHASGYTHVLERRGGNLLVFLHHSLLLLVCYSTLF